MISISRDAGKVKWSSEKLMKKKNGACSHQLKIVNNWQKKKRALAVLTEKAMINKTNEGNSLHDEYTMTARGCQGLQSE